MYKLTLEIFLIMSIFGHVGNIARAGVGKKFQKMRNFYDVTFFILKTENPDND